MIECSTFTLPKARKEHKCDLCRRTIPMGTKYVRFSGKFNGDYFDYKYHTECDTIINEYCTTSGETEWNDWVIFNWLQCVLCDNCDERDDCEKSVIDCYVDKGVLND